MSRVTPSQLRQMKERGEKIAMLTAYDYPTARMIDEAGVPTILVGDTLGMVVLGHDSTIPVRLDDIDPAYRGRAAGREAGADHRRHAFHDLSCQRRRGAAQRGAPGAGGRLSRREAGRWPLGRRAGAPPGRCRVSPSSATSGSRPSRSFSSARRACRGGRAQVARDLLQDAIALDEAGAFLLVLELVPTPLAGLISRRIGAPTIGIGAGPECDGQVQVISDILGLYPDFVPRHARLYAHVADTVRSVAGEYLQDVQGGAFPAAEHSSEMDTAILEGLEDPE